jgi:KaiC/GvpD/RAD55 family RecA-like ATPase
MPTNVAKVNEDDTTVLRANDCIVAAGRERPKAQLFDEFWGEGELALLFGAAGTGKSLLAVQIADALARGTPMHGFVMPRGRRKVLYIDLSLSDAQFRARYRSRDTPVHMRPPGERFFSNAEAASVGTGVSPLRSTRRFRFPKNLYRGRPKREADLLEWLQAAVKANNFRAVIVDDLTAVKCTYEGIRETLALMRGLKRLCEENGISILVLSDALVPKDGWASEHDLQRSRVLCTVADGVFCIGRMRRPDGGRRIYQTRSRASGLYWTDSNAPVAEIKRLESGRLGFEFDERFEPKLDEETRRLIVRVYELRAKGETFRSIAADLDISKSYAHELFQKWSPAVERGTISVDSCHLMEEEEGTTKLHEQTLKELDDDDWDETEISDTAEVWLAEECKTHDAQCTIEEQCTPPNSEFTVEDENIVHSASCIPKSIFNLEVEYNAYHQPIYVESRDERTRKPMVWYQQFPEGTRRFQRGPFSIQVQHMSAGP